MQLKYSKIKLRCAYVISLHKISTPSFWMTISMPTVTLSQWRAHEIWNKSQQLFHICAKQVKFDEYFWYVTNRNPPSIYWERVYHSQSDSSNIQNAEWHQDNVKTNKIWSQSRSIRALRDIYSVPYYKCAGFNAKQDFMSELLSCSCDWLLLHYPPDIHYFGLSTKPLKYLNILHA